MYTVDIKQFRQRFWKRLRKINAGLSELNKIAIVFPTVKMLRQDLRTKIVFSRTFRLLVAG